MQGHALTTASSTEVVAAFTAAPKPIPSVAATPGWYVLGSFFLPLSCQARLDVVGQVSQAPNVLHVRLFDMTALVPVSGASLSISETAETRRLSGVIALTGQRRYQIQAESVGTVGEAHFGLVQTATISE